MARKTKDLKNDAKAAIQLAFEDLGGQQRLVQWANSAPANLSAFYTQIWPKIIPKDIKASHSSPDGKPMKMVFEWQAPMLPVMDEITENPDE
jgi:hypothetical protein